MTDREKIMYDVIIQLAAADAPLVFKGGLITNLVLDENNYVGVRRATVDIDANWIAAPPTMQQLTGIFERALAEINPNYSIIPFREYKDKQSAGFNIFDNAVNFKAFSIDVEVKPVKDSRIYYFGEMSFPGGIACGNSCRQNIGSFY